MATSIGVPAPPKPWDRTGSSGPSPFRPSSATASTAAVVESAGVANPGDKNEATNVPPSSITNVGRAMPPRPWDKNLSGGYGPMTNYNQLSNYGSGSYGSGSYGASPYGNNYGGLYGNNGGALYGNTGGALYGNNGGAYGHNYRGGYGPGTYGGMHGGGYGIGNTYGGPYGGGYGMGSTYGPMGNNGMGPGGPLNYGQGDPNNPFGGGPPAGPPSFWQTMLHTMHGVVNFFGRVSILVDQNTQAFHFFITALLQLCDRTGLLYGELARFVLRLLGFRTSKKVQHNGPATRALPGQGSPDNYRVEETKDTSGAWDSVWSDDNLKRSGE